MTTQKLQDAINQVRQEQGLPAGGLEGGHHGGRGFDHGMGRGMGLDAAASAIGITPDQLRTVTVFLPRLKEPRDSESAAVVVTFNKPFDRAKLKAGFDKL